MRKLTLLVLCFAFMLPLAATADSYTVSVGYADGLRGTGFFPSPWQGDPGVIFVGTSGPGDDTGAIMITNTSGSAFTVNDVMVVIPGQLGGLYSFDLWGSNVVGAGQSLILVNTAFYNFDTSDYSENGACSANPSLIPTVNIRVNGNTTSFADSGQVLNTHGFDFACTGNESFRWREIGTTGDPAGTPEPSTLALLGTGSLGLLGSFKKRFLK